jgi:hypothetical protein
LIRVFDEAGTVIATHKQMGSFARVVSEHLRVLERNNTFVDSPKGTCIDRQGIIEGG